MPIDQNDQNKSKNKEISCLNSSEGIGASPGAFLDLRRNFLTKFQNFTKKFTHKNLSLNPDPDSQNLDPKH